MDIWSIKLSSPFYDQNFLSGTQKKCQNSLSMEVTMSQLIYHSKNEVHRRTMGHGGDGVFGGQSPHCCQ